MSLERLTKPHLFKTNLARKLDVGGVIMGAWSRTGILGGLLGIPLRLSMSKLDCSILAIKPAKFVSSVTLKKIKKS